MGDLQCAATLLLVPHEEADRLTDALGGVRVAHVWTSSSEPARAAAEALAAELGVGVSARDDLGQPPPTAPALADIADEHRGETVVVVTDVGDGVVEVAIDSDGPVRRRL